MAVRAFERVDVSWRQLPQRHHVLVGRDTLGAMVIHGKEHCGKEQQHEGGATP
jgi:hypothetical protein